MDIKLKKDDMVFAYRVAGVIRRDDKILVQKRIGDASWALPGGKCQFGEYSKETLKREILEETGVKVKVNNLLFVNELFYDIPNDSKNHQVVFYYAGEIEEDFGNSKNDEFDGIEEGKDIIYKWLKISDIETEGLKPDFLKKELVVCDTNLVKHIIDDERIK